MKLFLLTLAVMAAAMLIMAVGMFFKYPCLRGSCGGTELVAGDGDPINCEACPRRKSNMQMSA